MKKMKKVVWFVGGIILGSFLYSAFCIENRVLTPTVTINVRELQQEKEE